MDQKIQTICVMSTYLHMDHRSHTYRQAACARGLLTASLVLCLWSARGGGVAAQMEVLSPRNRYGRDIQYCVCMYECEMCGKSMHYMN